jgi:cell division protein FtsQ
MGRRTDSEAPKTRPVLAVLKYGLRIAAIGLILVAALYGYHRVELFLIRDPRFQLPTPEYGLDSPNLEVTGVKNASRMNVLRVFSKDFGRSVYLMPMKQRREGLRAVDWIRDASISRIWPNRIIVRVEERSPVAFIEIPSDTGRIARVALIDADGIILEPPQHALFHLPVVTGIRAGELLPVRRDRTHRMMRLMKDIGPMGERVSEVDVSDPDNLKASVRAGDHVVSVMLGDHNFAQRLENLVSHYAEIERRLPGARTLDLRLEDRITAVEDK